MFLALRVIALTVMLGCGAMRFRCILVMFSRLIVFVFRHWIFLQG
jgi:hypothetical protein